METPTVSPHDHPHRQVDGAHVPQRQQRRSGEEMCDGKQRPDKDIRSEEPQDDCHRCREDEQGRGDGGENGSGCARSVGIRGYLRMERRGGERRT